MRNTSQLFSVWDASGLKKQQESINKYYQQMNFCVLVYDLTKSEGFNSIKNWMNFVLSYLAQITQAYFPFILVGTFLDLKEQTDEEQEIFYKEMYNDTRCLQKMQILCRIQQAIITATFKLEHQNLRVQKKLTLTILARIYICIRRKY
ncbi:unnamed protein product (macronuclear) [Paramecium tetraurelia]|uniref:Uncharacterized protein n=1 Tax=Paramecium tetraurelia TaxID=5888 RepID=A0BZ74_PARTE|nr:uncharacterized protein GSPATT00033694001 [Paramecium tetraurelia]CAK63841.1 unnamed protein product [Paramecium tetraurelia]|eukprot:XP_001431239.1 hypothetical protein (macronuclear) [Paramecium tetraurelia strain d4-2]